MCIRDRCEKIAAQAASDNVDHLSYLLQLCELELLERERKSAERRMKAAKLDVYKRQRWRRCSGASSPRAISSARVSVLDPSSEHSSE